MRMDNGGYISSLSALDGEGVEGGYYLWSIEELGRLLDESERELAGYWLGLQGNAVFEAGHLPMRVREPTGEAADPDAPLPRRALEKIETKLRHARARRELPRDDKQLASWNGLLLQGMVELARVSGRERHRAAARELRDFLRGRLIDGDVLYRMRGQDDFAVAGDLEDHAQVAAGLLAWAEFTDSSRDRAQARVLVDQAWQRFYGAEGWRLTTSPLLALPSWQEVIEDGPLPSPVGTLLAASQRLAPGAEMEDWPVAEALARAAPYVTFDPFAYASYAILLGKPGDGGVQITR
jgi:hypothetical protein